MNLLAVKPGIEASYGIYLLPVWFLYLPAFFLQEGERGVLKVKLAAGGGG